MNKENVYTVAEYAAREGITRQGVHYLIKKKKVKAERRVRKDENGNPVAFYWVIIEGLKDE